MDARNPFLDPQHADPRPNNGAIYGDTKGTGTTSLITRCILGIVLLGTLSGVVYGFIRLGPHLGKGPAAPAPPPTSPVPSPSTSPSPGPALPTLQPFALQNGSTVAFISPASPPIYHWSNATHNITYQQHVDTSMSALGLKAKFGENAFKRNGFLAGTDEERASDVMNAFMDRDVMGIVSNRGGWGCARILPLLNYTIIQQHPKVITGYSDVTSLLSAIHHKTGMVVFHGPMGISDWASSSLDYTGWSNMVMKAGAKGTVIQNPAGSKGAIVTLKGGKGKGKLIGGNLSVFVGIVGTEYFPDVNGAVLFLEDVGEQPYAIDRMVTQLALAGVFNNITGFVWGQCPTSCAASDPSESLSLKQIFDEHISSRNIPSFMGLQFGHIDQQLTLPIGAQVELDANTGTVTLLQDTVLPVKK